MFQCRAIKISMHCLCKCTCIVFILELQFKEIKFNTFDNVYQSVAVSLNRIYAKNGEKNQKLSQIVTMPLLEIP